MLDHPRIRGEHLSFSAVLQLSRGSSPHTRGAPHERRPFAFDDGIIPAYAGSTRHSSCHRGPAWDHPRIRGEHCEGHLGWGVPCGSSPHTRGALLHSREAVGETGIIPAYAGSTKSPKRARAWQPDHPRIRGEHGCRAVYSLGEFGSSPHTRGAQGGAPADEGAGRIIPAYAGSTSLGTVKTWSTPDHPRIRGEHSTSR